MDEENLRIAFGENWNQARHNASWLFNYSSVYFIVVAGILTLGSPNSQLFTYGILFALVISGGGMIITTKLSIEIYRHLAFAEHISNRLEIEDFIPKLAGMKAVEDNLLSSDLIAIPQLWLCFFYFLGFLSSISYLLHNQADLTLWSTAILTLVVGVGCLATFIIYGLRKKHETESIINRRFD